MTTPTARTCRRCKGTGQARFNHMNGDTHCYLCQGTGVQVTWPTAAREQHTTEDQWVNDAYMKLVGGLDSYENQIRRPVRAATETTPWVGKAERETMTEDELATYEAGQVADRTAASQLRRRLTFWVGDALMEMQQAVVEARRTAETDAISEFRTTAN